MWISLSGMGKRLAFLIFSIVSMSLRFGPFLPSLRGCHRFRASLNFVWVKLKLIFLFSVTYPDFRFETPPGKFGSIVSKVVDGSIVSLGVKIGRLSLAPIFGRSKVTPAFFVVLAIGAGAKGAGLTFFYLLGPNGSLPSKTVDFLIDLIPTEPPTLYTSWWMSNWLSPDYLFELILLDLSIRFFSIYSYVSGDNLRTGLTLLSSFILLCSLGR